MKKKTLTKASIIQAVYDKVGYSKTFTADLVDFFFSSIKSHLQKGQGIQFQGFGKFILKDKKARKGRNPQTGKSLIIPKRRVLLFKTSASLKKKFSSSYK